METIVRREGYYIMHKKPVPEEINANLLLVILYMTFKTSMSNGCSV